MSKGLKGITVKIDGDTKPLNQALSKVNAESKSLQGELKGINSLLKFDPQNTELLAQKQTVLSKAIEQTESKLKTLEQAQKQMAEAGKDVNDEAYRDLQREIFLTKKKLADYNVELENTQAQQKQTAKEAQAFGKKIGEIATKIPGINKLVTAYGKVKEKIAETVKENEHIRKLSQYAADAKEKLNGFADKHPIIKKIGEAFGDAKEKASELAQHLPSVSGALKATGQAAGAAATGILKIGAAVTGAMAAGLGYTIKFADEAKGALNDFSATTGITGDNLKKFEGVMKEIYADNFGENMQDVAESMALVQKNSRLIDPAEAKKVTEYAMALRDTFGYDIQEQMRAANMLMDQFGITSDEAFNLIAQGAQDGWLDKNGDMLDSINEYSVHFKQLGLGAENMFNSLANGAYSGAFSVDKCGDAIKEFGIRVKDGTADDAFKQLGLSVDETKNAFNAGGESAKKAMQEVADALFSMQDPVAQNVLGVQMFGTMWEDLGAEGVQAITDIAGEFDKTYDAMQQINAIKYNTFGEAMQGLGRILQTSFILPIGEEALPIFTEFAQELSKGAAEAEGDVGKMADAAGEAVGGLLDGLGEMIPQLAQIAAQIVTGLAGAIVSNIPMLATVGADILQQLITGIVGMIPTLTQSITEIIPILANALVTLFPQIISAGAQILVNLIQGITQSIPSLIQAIVDLIPAITQAIFENLPLIIDAGLNLLIALVNGMMQAQPQLIAMLPTLINTIVTNIVSMLPQIIETGIQLLNSLVSGIIQAIPQLIAALPQIITSTVNTIIANLPKIIQTGIELLGALISGIIRAIPSLVAALPQVFKAIIDTFRGVNWADLGKNIIDGVIQGVKNAAGSLIQVFKDLAKQALDAVKDFFGIKSPSKVMRDQVGKMLPAGMAEGVEDGMDAEEKRIKAAMARGVPTTIDGYIKAGGSGAAGDAQTAAGGGGFVQNLTINSPRELSPSETARMNRNAMRQTVLKLKPT